MEDADWLLLFSLPAFLATLKRSEVVEAEVVEVAKEASFSVCCEGAGELEAMGGSVFSSCCDDDSVLLLFNVPPNKEDACGKG